jgi:parallel beta-helix repeat protein
VHHNGISNIFTGVVNNLRIENNVVHGAYSEHGIYVSGSANDHVIRNNVSHSNRGSGIYVNGDGSLGGSGVVANARIENNRIYNNGASGGSAVNLDGVQNSTIQNNLLYENHGSGISLFGTSSGNLIANNTVVNAADGRWALNIQDGSTGNTAFNNILFSLSNLRGSIDLDAASLAGFVSDHNLVEDLFALGGTFADVVQWRSQTGDDAGSLTLTRDELMALFADYAGQDFQLKNGSLAIDRGTASLLNGIERNAPGFDLLMALRPAGVGYDIGAFEAQPVPEPGTWMMLLAGGALVVWTTARRTRCRQ